jgi:adenylate cyclase
MPLWVQVYLAACHGLKGDADGARHHAAEVMRMQPGFTIRRYSEKDLYKRAEDQRKLSNGLRLAGLPE